MRGQIEGFRGRVSRPPGLGSGMTPELAAKAYDVYVNDKTGFFRRPIFDAEGAKTVLALRSKYGVPQKTLTDAARYYDTSYLEAAGIK